MWIVVFALLLLGAQLNLSGLVPLQDGGSPPPWWVGGRLIWPFAENTHTLLSGDLLNTLTPTLAVSSAICFLMAAAALMKWHVPGDWFPMLIVCGAILSMGLQIIWFSGWAIAPLIVDILLLWAVFGWHITVNSLRA